MVVITRSTIAQMRQPLRTRSQLAPNAKLFNLSPKTRPRSKPNKKPTPKKSAYTPSPPHIHHIVNPVPFQTPTLSKENIRPSFFSPKPKKSPKTPEECIPDYWTSDHEIELLNSEPLAPLTLELPDTDDESDYYSDEEVNVQYPDSSPESQKGGRIYPEESIHHYKDAPPPKKQKLNHHYSGLILRFKVPKEEEVQTPFEPDFDESSEEWNANKRKLPNGCYQYLCGKINEKTGKKCKKPNHDNIGIYSGCKMHYMWEEKELKYMF